MSPEVKLGMTRRVLRKKRRGLLGNLPDLLRKLMKRKDNMSKVV